MFNPVFKTKPFAGHGHDRLHLLDGKPLASFAMRAIAFAIDLAIVDIALSLGRIAWGLAASETSPATTVKFVSLQTWWVLVMVVVYFGVLTHFGRGQTPGKRLVRIRVVSLVHDQISLWHSVERALGYAASTLEAGFGFLQYFIHPNTQTVHDRIAETIVVSERHAHGTRVT